MQILALLLPPIMRYDESTETIENRVTFYK